MADKITSLTIKDRNTNTNKDIPIGVKAENIDWTENDKKKLNNELIEKQVLFDKNISVGNVTTPIYFNNGEPTPCNAVPDVTDSSSGLMTPELFNIIHNLNNGGIDYKNAPIASNDALGFVKIGNNINIDNNGRINAVNTTYNVANNDNNIGLIDYNEINNINNRINNINDIIDNNNYIEEIPIASNSILGGVKIGEGININSEGTISVNIIESEIPLVSNEQNGLMRAEDKIKLDNIILNNDDDDNNDNDNDNNIFYINSNFNILDAINLIEKNYLSNKKYVFIITENQFLEEEPLLIKNNYILYGIGNIEISSPEITIEGGAYISDIIFNDKVIFNNDSFSKTNFNNCTFNNENSGAEDDTYCGIYINLNVGCEIKFYNCTFNAEFGLTDLKNISHTIIFNSCIFNLGDMDSGDGDTLPICKSYCFKTDENVSILAINNIETGYKIYRTGDPSIYTIKPIVPYGEFTLQYGSHGNNIPQLNYSN